MLCSLAQRVIVLLFTIRFLSAAEFFQCPPLCRAPYSLGPFPSSDRSTSPPTDVRNGIFVQNKKLSRDGFGGTSFECATTASPDSRNLWAIV